MTPELISLDHIEALAQEYGYWVIFIGIMMENAGLPIPGETVSLVGGFLAGNDELKYWYVLGAAIAGATLGDNFGYWVGYWGGWPLLQRIGKILRISDERLESVRQRFSDNAPKAVFIGRFIALLRIFAGPLAGTVRMPYPWFLLCNLAGATLWATVMITLAYFVGRIVVLEQLVSWAAQFTVLALFVVIAAIAIPIWLEARSQRSESKS